MSDVIEVLSVMRCSLLSVAHGLLLAESNSMNTISTAFVDMLNSPPGVFALTYQIETLEMTGRDAMTLQVTWFLFDRETLEVTLTKGESNLHLKFARSVEVNCVLVNVMTTEVAMPEYTAFFLSPICIGAGSMNVIKAEFVNGTIDLVSNKFGL
jgi:hypothetical protein